MSLLNSISPLIRACQMGGLITISANKIGNLYKWEKNGSLTIFMIIWMIFHISSFSLFVLTSDVILKEIDTNIGLVLLSFMMIVRYMSALAQLIELYLKRDQQKQLFDLFQHLDASMMSRLNKHLNYGGIKRYCLYLNVAWISAMLVPFILIWILNKTLKLHAEFHYISFYIPPSLFNKLGMACFTLLVKLIGENLKVLTDYLKLATKSNGYYIRESYEDTGFTIWNRSQAAKNPLEVSMIIFLQQSYSSIWEISAITNNLFRWSLAIIILTDFFEITFHFYYFCFFLFFETSTLTFFFWIPFILGYIFFISNICNRTAVMVSLIVYFIQFSIKSYFQD